MDLIVTHTNADFDALSSMIAAKKLYPQAQIVLPSSQERSVREFLNLWMDSIDALPEKEASFRNVERLIIVETRFASRIGRAAILLDNKDIDIHIYDHHPRTKDDIKAGKDIYRKYGATVTILLDLIKKKNIKLTPLEATIMALGIYEDTGNLTFRTTTQEDVDMASFLVECGADLNVVGFYVREELDVKEINLLAKLLQSIEVFTINGVDVTILTSQTASYLGDFSLVVHRFIDITHKAVVFALNKIDGRIQIVSRSHIPNVNVATIMGFLGGGGHPTAASAIVKGTGIDKIKKRILRLLKNHIKVGIYAEGLACRKFRFINGNDPLRSAVKLFKEKEIENLIVMEKNTPIGILNIKDLSTHKSLKVKIRGVHFKRTAVVTKDLSIYQMKKVLLEEKSHALIVKDNNKIIGFITRAGLLEAFFEEVSKGRYAVSKKPSLDYGQSMNISDRIKFGLPKRIVRMLKLIGNLGDKMNSQTFVVGGFVRDLLMGVKNFDIDIVVETNAIDFARQLADIMNASLVVHRKFGTASVVIDWPKDLPRVGVMLTDKFKIDIATARIETYERPAALPTVSFSSIKEDLYRRDFTINAMAVSLNKSSFGVVIDFFGAGEDIKSKKIRVLHDQSFIDDPTRIFRAVRFEQRFDFQIDEYTQDLIKNAISLEMFERTQKQRLRDELILILSEPKPIKAIMRMNELHELRFIHPKLKFDKRILDLLESVEETSSWFKLSFLKRRLIDTWLIYFMALMDRLSLADVKAICQKFVFKKSDEGRILAYKKIFLKSLSFLDSSRKLKPSQIYNLLEPFSYEVILLLMAKSKSSRAKKRISTFLTRYNGIRLSISGKDLQDMNLKPGPRFKNILALTLNAKVDGILKNKRDELAFAKKIIRG